MKQTFTTDAQERLWKTRNGSGHEIEREYGVVGSSGSCPSCTPLLGRVGGGFERLNRIIYPTFTKEFDHDNQGRVSEERYVFSGGTTYSVTFTYDAFGRLESTTGPDNQTTTYSYDLLGRRIGVTDSSGTTQFEYDLWDNLIALTDAENQRTEFEYYPDGKLKLERRPMGAETTYEYDTQGRLGNVTDAKNQTTEYGYDEQSRIETLTYADGKTVTLTYDDDGNLSGYHDGETSASYTFDAMGRKLTETVNYGPFSKSFSYTYYGNGLKHTFTSPDSPMYTYLYGLNNELQDIQIPGLGSITIPAYTWNRPATINYPGGTQRTYAYDSLMRIQSLNVTDPSSNPLLNYQYSYDEVGNILTKTTKHGLYGYDYDDSSQLITADNPVLADESYTYDDVGNRLTASGVTGTWSYNQNNELLGFADVKYTYDENGNLTQITVAGQVVWTYTYDATNRLKYVEDGTETISADYYYDPFGRRLWKDVGGTRTYFFFYSEEGLIAEYDATGTEIRSYGYQPDSTWTTDPLFQKVGSTYYWYQNDHLGTPQKLTATDGTVVWSAQYTAFGEANVQVETVTNNLRFAGQYADAETGLHYNFQRYYDPKIGRYLRIDPPGIFVDVNLFAYVKNRPINYFDDSGLKIKGVYIVRGKIRDGRYGFDYQYRQDGCSVTVRIKLIDQTPPPYLNDPIIETWRRHPEKILKRWETEAEEKWSHKFACCDPDGFTNQRLCCKGLCIITVDVQFVTSGEDAIVNVHHGWSRRYPGYPTFTDASNWWIVDSGDLIAHEIGHHLGLNDEYVNLGMAPNRHPVNTGTVMDNPTGPAVLRHFRGICRNIEKVPTTLRGTGFE